MYKIIEKYTDEFNVDVKITDMNLHDKAQMCSGLKMKWLRIRTDEHYKLRQLEKKRLELIESNKLEIQKNAMGNKPNYIADREIMQMKDIKKIQDLIEKQKDVVQFLDGAVDIIKGFGFDIKACVELLKVES